MLSLEYTPAFLDMEPSFDILTYVPRKRRAFSGILSMLMQLQVTSMLEQLWLMIGRIGCDDQTNSVYNFLV
jgi:hypothetical protein